MKKKFSTKWKGSKQPRKQRKYSANAPLHIMRKFLSANLSKELRSKQGKRSLPLRKGDTVKIMRGKFKGKTGKITEIKTKLQKVYVEKMQAKKQDGSKVNVPFKASNLQIIQLNLDDRKRKISESGKKSEVKKEAKTEVKTEKKTEEKDKKETKKETKNVKQDKKSKEKKK